MSGQPSVEILHRTGDGVGESLQWLAEERALYWVDITGRAVKRFEPQTGRADLWATPGMPAAFVPRVGGGAVVSLDNRVVLFDFSDRFEAFVVPEPDRPANRLNDAAADPKGRLWVGTMENNIEPDGSPRPITGKKGMLYVIEPDGACRLASEHRYGVTNTLVWRGETFITADTSVGELYAFDFDGPTGTISNRRLFAAEPRLPDGSCLDRDGYLWNARFGGGCVMRFDPEGRLDQVVHVPVRNPTTCCFGGEGLSTLFVTSSRYGLDRDHGARNPDAGGLMAIDVGVPGVPTFRFAG